jgi:N4-gp56 family major capsid protein
MAISTSLNQSAVIMQWFKRKALDRLVQKTHLYELGYKNTLPANSGKSVTWIRFGLQSGDAAAVAAATTVEGQLMTPQNITSRNISVNLVQYAGVFACSDILEATSVTPMEEALQEQATQQMAYIVESVCRAAVDSSCVTAGTDLFTPSTVANNVIANITASDVLKAADIRKAVGRLSRNAVPKFGGTKYSIVMHTSQAVDIRSESGVGGFLTLAQQTVNTAKDIADGYKLEGFIGSVFGADLYETALQPVINNGTVDVFYAYAFGDNSLGVANLDSQEMEVYRKFPGAGSTYDTVEQIKASVGWKTFFAAKNLTGVETGTPALDARILVLASAASI